MKLAVVGSRGIFDKNLIFNKLDEIHSSHKIEVIISGGGDILSGLKSRASSRLSVGS